MDRIEEWIEGAARHSYERVYPGEKWAEASKSMQAIYRDGARPAVEFVIEQHVKPLLAEAFRAGRKHGVGGLYTSDPNDYAARICRSLTGDATTEGER